MAYNFNPFTGNLDEVGAAAAAFEVLGTVATVGDLPGGATQGDVYLVEADDNFYVWDGSAWSSLGTLAGPQGPTGAVGPAGADGADGVGVDAGGTTGQVLAKASGTDYDTEWVDQTGGGGTPGGADTQVQFNDGGAFGGDAGLVYDKTTDKLTVAGDIDLDDGGTFSTTLQSVTPTANRTVSIPDATGTIGLVNGPTGSIQFNEAGALNGTSDFSTTLEWNNASTIFTGLKLNVTDTASSADSKLLDLQSGGTSVFKVNSSGAISVPLGTKNNAGISFGASDEGFYSIGTGFAFSIATNTPVFAVRYVSPGLTNLSQYWGLGISRNAFIAWGSQFDATQNHDLAIGRDAANTFAQRNGTNAQTYRLYNTYNSPTDYARGYFTFSGQELQIGTEKQTQVAAQAIRLKTATQTEPIYLAPGGFNFFSVDSVNQVRTGLPINMAAAYTFATLPAGAVGYITRITDGDASLTPGTVLSGANTGNGTNTPYLCWYNGTNWTVIGA